MSAPESETTVEAPRPRAARGLRARIAVSVVASAVVCWVIWTLADRQLKAPLDIVGYPAFADYNFPRVFLTYRLLVWAFPLLAAAVFVLLGRVGPFARARSAERQPVAFSQDPVHEPPASGLGRLPRILPVMAVIAIAGSSGPTVAGTHVNLHGILPAFAYGVVVVASAWLVARGRRAATRTWLETFSLINALLGSLATVAGISYFVSRTAVLHQGLVDHWPWWSLWFAVCLAVAVLVQLLVLLWRGTKPEVLEWRVLTIGVGSAAVFLTTASMPGASGPLQGFDDMMSLTGADLMGRGYFPWRDFTFIHGLFEDSLRSSVGFSLFQHSVWGAAAATTAIWVPLCWIAVYLFGVWTAPRRWVVHVVLILLTVYWADHGYQSLRWVAVALVLVLLGESIGRPGVRWTILFTTALFVEAVLVPEASYQVLASVFVLVMSDVMHRPVGISAWRSLRKTRIFVLTGGVLTVAWGGFLALIHALGAFVDYFLIFGPGHAASGALPLPNSASLEFTLVFIGVVATVIVSICSGLVWFLGRRPMTPRRWVGVAATILAGLYAEKALGRFDDGHIVQSTYVALPLVLVWFTGMVGAVDDRIQAMAVTRNHQRLAFGWLRYPASTAALLFIVIAVPSISSHVWTSSSNNKSVVPGSTAPLVGYTLSDTLDAPRLQDLRSVTDSLAGPGSSVFDFSNSPGYFYYLLQRNPPTPFYHVSMAIPAFSQKMLVRDLEKSRPPVVVFDSDGVFGLSTWDGVANDIRHFIVSQYVLDHWTPVVRASGVLFLLRNDLLNSRRPLPVTNTPLQTRDLYSSTEGCDWGDVPNFLQSSAAGRSNVLRGTDPSFAQKVTVKGWAYDTKRHRPVVGVVAAVSDRVVKPSFPIGYDPDRADQLGARADDPIAFATSITTRLPGTVDLYAVLRNGRVHPLSGATPNGLPRTLLGPNGSRLRVDPTPVTGDVLSTSVERGSVTRFDVPPSVDLSSVRAATFTTRGEDIGRSTMELTSVPPGPTTVNRTISLDTLSDAGRSVPVRVGACLEWHGFSSQGLFLAQFGGQPVTRIRLSGVKD